MNVADATFETHAYSQLGIRKNLQLSDTRVRVCRNPKMHLSEKHGETNLHTTTLVSQCAEVTSRGP